MGRVQAKAHSSQHPRTSDQAGHCLDFAEVRPNSANAEEHLQVRLTETKPWQEDFRGMYLVI